MLIKDPDEGDRWDPIASVGSPLQALRGCSECLEVVREILQIPYSRSMDDGIIRVRVHDSVEDRVVLWDDENGSLHWEEKVYAENAPKN